MGWDLFQYKAVSSYSRGDNTSPNGTPQSLLFHTFELLQTARRYACPRQRGCLPASPKEAWRAPPVPGHHGNEFAADKEDGRESHQDQEKEDSERRSSKGCHRTHFVPSCSLPHTPKSRSFQT